jgi:competence protein ComEC
VKRQHLNWRDRAWLVGLAGLAVGWVFLLVGLTQRPDGLLHLWALDVGQGDALLIRTPGGQTVLVDGGPNPAIIDRQVGTHLPFWQHRLDLLVLTHPHEDHISGLIEVMHRYEVGRVLTTPYTDTTAPLETTWLGQLALVQVPVTPAQDGQVIPLESGITLRVLYPGGTLPHGTNSDSNNASVVLRLDYGTVHMLLMGDIETEAGQLLLAAHPADLQAQVLKVPHHGSGTGLSPALLTAIHPSLALISVGADNLYHHPATSTLHLLQGANVPIYRTDHQGTVEVLSDGQQVWVRAER